MSVVSSAIMQEAVRVYSLVLSTRPAPIVREMLGSLRSSLANCEFVGAALLPHVRLSCGLCIERQRVLCGLDVWASGVNTLPIRI